MEFGYLWSKLVSLTRERIKDGNDIKSLRDRINTAIDDINKDIVDTKKSIAAVSSVADNALNVANAAKDKSNSNSAQIADMLVILAQLQEDAQKGNLIVKVGGATAQAPLSYTVTVKPKSGGGSAITKEGTGNSEILFTGLKQGQYIVSFSENSNYTKPANQTATVTGKKTTTINANYQSLLSTVTVNVSADILLDNFSYSLTIRGGGVNQTKQGSGAGAVVFRDLLPNTYTITASNINGYYAPSQQSITVSGGQNKTVSMAYSFKPVSFATAPWSTIDAVSRAGYARSMFNLGDSRRMTLLNESVEFTIIGFGHDNLASGGKAGITLGITDGVLAGPNGAVMNSTQTNNGGYPASDMYSFLHNNVYNDMPYDLQRTIKPVRKQSFYNGSVNTDSMKLFPYGVYEALDESTIIADGHGSSTPRDGQQYELFKTQPDLILGNYSRGYYTRSADKWDGFCVVCSEYGVAHKCLVNADEDERYYVFGFCI